MTPIPKPRKVVQDESRLEFVREMACLIVTAGPCSQAILDHADVCGWYDPDRPANRQCEAHHIRKGTQTGLSRKPAAFEAKYGLDLEAHLLRINREFDAQSSTPKCTDRTLQPSPAKDKRAAIGLTVKHCLGCGRTHAFLPQSKWQRGTREIRYFCSSRNAYFTVEIGVI